ncbi:conserved hypothetical protein [Nostocoides japonicum T1-X7]|uniref:Uncharacterized protein n=1 Tax=Nostocoides japonicum T1-X7 TaxID=1194083 RepID=A0A077LV50_9MICO|nr:hypothetical protein [Tetrasphaera japonica]CCH75885.1 conserved hypothetical protein [Tetrasphaera japonica T1-X7]
MLTFVSDAQLMLSCAEALVRDAAATTGLRVTLSIWNDRANGIGAVVHESAVEPSTPVWEAVGWVEGGDCLAVHSPSAPTEAFPENGDRTEVTYDIANAAQQLVQVLLWRQGSDPTWPPCPEHPGRHPLRPEDSRWRRDGAVEAEGALALWVCPTGTTAIAIGDLPGGPP